VYAADLRTAPSSVAVASLLLYAAAVVQVIAAAMVAASARAWDRAWQAADTSGDFSAEAPAVITASVIWIGLAVVLAVQTAWLGSARKASVVGVSVLGWVLVLGNLCGAYLLSSPDLHRPHSRRLQRAIDEFVPVWYQVVPVGVLASAAAIMIVLGLGILLTPSSRQFFAGTPGQPR
jgi:hypothetical protein